MLIRAIILIGIIEIGKTAKIYIINAIVLRHVKLHWVYPIVKSRLLYNSCTICALKCKPYKGELGISQLEKIVACLNYMVSLAKGSRLWWLACSWMIGTNWPLMFQIGSTKVRTNEKIKFIRQLIKKQNKSFKVFISIAFYFSHLQDLKKAWSRRGAINLFII